MEYVLTGRIGNISDRRSYQEESYHLGGEESEARVDIKGECWNVISTLDQPSVPSMYRTSNSVIFVCPNEPLAPEM